MRIPSVAGLAAGRVGNAAPMRSAVADRVTVKMPADSRFVRVAGVIVAEAAARAGLSVHQVEEAAAAAVEACAAHAARGGTVALEVMVQGSTIDVRAAATQRGGNGR